MNLHSDIEVEKNRIRRAIAKRLKRIEKGIAGKQKALLDALNASFVEHQGELLKANFHALKPAMKEITLSDWLHDEKPLTIQLDPELTPTDQLKAIFKRAKKTPVPRLDLSNSNWFSPAEKCALFVRTIRPAALTNSKVTFASCVRSNEIFENSTIGLGQTVKFPFESPASVAFFITNWQRVVSE